MLVNISDNNDVMGYVKYLRREIEIITKMLDSGIYNQFAAYDNLKFLRSNKRKSLACL